MMRTRKEVKFYMGTDLCYFQTDVVNKKLYIQNVQAGGDSPKALDIAVEVLTGTAGYRQGALAIGMNRADGQVLTTGWDGNPDCSLKIQTTNRANNLDGATRIGGFRGADINSRNRGTNASWVNGINLGARNDSGKNVSELSGMHIRCENYGNIYTSNIGLDIEMSDENVTQSQIRVGLQIRNTDLSAQAAVDDVIKISHSGTNGFTNLVNFASASGDPIATGSLKMSDETDVKCDARIKVVWATNVYYIPAYNTVV